MTFAHAVAHIDEIEMGVDLHDVDRGHASLKARMQGMLIA